jgi:hybrid polyketide synthase/nonribosomal peptide synthetase ACE1
MPPIAGVANAALVMRDGLFLDMEAAGFNQALGPKMHGSIYLDELFSDAPLDFFILYSSLVFVTGNTGQVAYSAGNAFMVSLTHGRRARGQVGSVMGLAGISGIGYITRTDHNILNRLDILGYGVMSEWDYCYFFAEAVLAGKPDSGRNPEVSAGVSYVDPTKETGVPKWIEDPKFGHFRLDRRSETGTEQGTDNVVSMKAELLEAKSEQRAFEIVLGK